MIRFRLGQAWKRERERLLQDSFGLDLDGIEILPTATEEALATVVPDLVDAVSALCVEGSALAQISLPEAHLEIALHRVGNTVNIAVVDLGRPAHLSRGPIKLELSELAAATMQCARVLMKDLADCAPSFAHTASVQRMLKQLHALAERPISDLAEQKTSEGLRWHSGPTHPKSFEVHLTDPQNLILSLDSNGRGALTSLLFEGSLCLWLNSEGPAWRAQGRPFLLTHEISRQAGELSQAIELQERSFSLQLGGVGPPFQLDLVEGRALVDRQQHELTGADLARAMFHIGLSIGYSLAAHNRNQRRNPYVVALVERCRDGLASLRVPIQPSREGTARARPDRVVHQRPVNRTGRLRRLRFSKLWEKHRLGGDEKGRLVLGPRGPVFASAVMACGFSPSGEMLFRRVSAHGIAFSEQWVLTASSNRIECFVGSEQSARWTRDHDGSSIGPELHRKNGLLIAVTASGAVIAFSEVTGRQMWRIGPGRSRHAYLTIQGHRAVVAADSGQLYGLDLQDGQERYRLHSALPFAGPATAWGKRTLAAAGRRERFCLLAADAHSGSLHWKCELDLTSLSALVPQRSRVFVAGERAGQGIVMCLGLKGQLIWERRLHLGEGPFTLVAPSQRVIASSPRGGAVSFATDGQIEWRLGALQSELLWPCAPVLARGVAVIPGDIVRAVDVHSGELLAEVRAGIGLCDLQADSKLNLYLLDEDGTLSAYQLASHFAIISGE
jgi:outer membrane protein assembly factor BamB